MPDLNGQIVTFYSYKGGTGRTMALANVAWILAANGKQVLVADWDLESPGLHRFYHPFIDTEIREAKGIIDMIRDHDWAADRALKRSPGLSAEALSEAIGKRARVHEYAFSLNWRHFPLPGTLDFLSPGRQNRDYATTLGGLNWDDFYNERYGAQFLEDLRADLKKHYDYILIDSRTGLSDIADICTMHLPDVLVDCFTLSIQGIEGAAQVARSVREQTNRDIRILPVPMRVDPAEKMKVDAGFAVALDLFSDIPPDASAGAPRGYWTVEVPYRAFYAYEETLAVFGDRPEQRFSLLKAFEQLTAQITQGAVTELPPMDEALRKATLERFDRKPRVQVERVVLDYAPDDQIWAEWITSVLREADVEVKDPAAEFGASWKGQPSLRLAIASAANRPSADTDLVIHLTEASRSLSPAVSARAFLAGAAEADAVERIARLVGKRIPSLESVRAHGVRYPRTEPRLFKAPSRNIFFTGREEGLRQIRRRLQESLDSGSPMPIVVLGSAGVGKTQVAMEYVYRFRTEYDLVWWVDCGEAQFVETLLGDLVKQVQDVFGNPALPTVTPADVSRAIKQVLGSEQTVGRWLLIFDNADDIEEIARNLPTGNGHTLITSQNQSWAQKWARALPLEVFSRQESVDHLQRRVETITTDDAHRVAELLEDLPLAVATAGAWLQETNLPVASYLPLLERGPSEALSVSQVSDYPQPVTKAWDLSLTRLADRSPAAARLLQLCSLMAPNVSLSLIYRPAMVDALAPYRPHESEAANLGKYVQEINRLALIKLERKEHQIRLHRVLRDVIRNHHMSDEERKRAFVDIHRVLAAARPQEDVDDRGTWEQYLLIWPHLDFAEVARSPLAQARRLLIDRVRYLWIRGDLARAEDVATRTETAWQEMIEADPDDVQLQRQLLHLQFNKANVLRERGKFVESHALAEHVVDAQSALFGKDDFHTLMTRASLSADLRALGRYNESLEMDKVTYQAWNDLFGENHPRTLAAANNLGVSYRVTGDYRRALDIDQDTFERRREWLGAKHLNTLSSAVNAARDLLEAGRYAEVVELMRDVTETCVESLGADAAWTLNARVLLGIGLRSSGIPAEAERHFEEALRLYRDRFGADSPDALACRLGHASNLLALDRFEEAGAEILAVLDIYREQLGPDHPHTLACRVNLATSLHYRRLYDEGLKEADAAARGLAERLGPDHPSALAASMVKAVLLTDLGQYEDALPLERDAAHRLDRVLGAHHLDALRCHANRLLTEHDLGIPGAMAERDRVIERLAAYLGGGHPIVATLQDGKRVLRTLNPPAF